MEFKTFYHSFKDAESSMVLLETLYRSFWNSCNLPSAFISPSTVSLLIDKYSSEYTIVACYVVDVDIEAFGWFYVSGKTIVPLSSGNGDYNALQVLDTNNKDACINATQNIFTKLLEKGHRIKWKNFPIDSYMGKSIEQLNKSKVTRIRYSECPINRQENPLKLYQSVSSKKLIYYKRRLIKKGAFFHCDTDDRDLDRWVQSFALNHRSRWRNQGSKYFKEENIHFLCDRIKAWIKDGIAFRFTVELNNEPIAMCLGVREGSHRLIYHSVVYNEKFGKFSPGMALIQYIVEVMVEYGFCELDFGEGEEVYKKKFVNSYSKIDMVYIHNNLDIFHILAAQIFRLIYENRLLQYIMKNYINKFRFYKIGQ